MRWCVVRFGVWCALYHPRAKPATVMYTSYLLRVVSIGSHAEGLSALLPCFWVDHHVGTLMLAARGGGSASRPAEYDSWIDMYAGDAFADAVRVYRALVEVRRDTTPPSPRGQGIRGGTV